VRCQHPDNVPRRFIVTYHLAANAVNGNASGAPLLDVLDKTLGLTVVGDIKVVVVDVQLGRGVSGTSGLEGNADVVLADDLQPVALPESTVLVEDLVGDVLRSSVLVSMKTAFRTTHPCVDLALVAADDGLDVVLHDRDQGGLVVDGGDPAGDLAVPDKGVTTDELAVGLSPVDEPVSTSEVELATRRLGGIELHGVLGGDLAEVGLGSVVDVGVAENVLVAGSAPVPSLLSVRLNCIEGFRIWLTSCPWP
jgi:hypothetical protein